MSKTAVAAPLPSAATSREAVALVLLVATAVVAFFGVPGASWRVSPFDPCHLGILGGGAAIATLVCTRFFGERALGLERLVVAFFLFAMPPIYVGSLLVAPPPGGLAPWLYIELAAIPLYGGLAVAGYRRWPALLVLGIAAHGLGWDAWHYGHSSYVPDWYALSCLALDLTLALYIGARIPRWRAAPANA